MKPSAKVLLVAFFLSLTAAAPALAANPQIEKIKEILTEFQDAFKQKDYQQAELLINRANRIIERAIDQGDGDFVLDPECEAVRNQVEALTTDFRFEKACEDYFSALEQAKNPLSSDELETAKSQLQDGVVEILRLRDNGFDLYADREIAGGKRVRAIDILDGCQAKLSEMGQSAN